MCTSRSDIQVPRFWQLSLVAWALSFLFVPVTFAQQGLLPDQFAEGKVIVIDPGHGGHDAGARTPTGGSEKNITLQLALELKEALHGFCRVHLTRDGDYWVDLERRTALANHHRADAFISLHAAKGLNTFREGVLVFRYVGEAGPSFSPAREDGIDETSQHLPVWDEVQSAHVRRSRLLVDSLQDRLVETGYSSTRGPLGAPLYVLKGADMAAAVIEIGHIRASDKQTHTSEEDDGIKSVAQAIARGLNDYFGKSGSCVEIPDMVEEDIYTGRGAVW